MDYLQLLQFHRDLTQAEKLGDSQWAATMREAIREITEPMDAQLSALSLLARTPGESN